MSYASICPVCPSLTDCPKCPSMTIPYILIGICLIIFFYFISKSNMPSDTCMKIIDAYNKPQEVLRPASSTTSIGSATSTHGGAINARSVNARSAGGARGSNYVTNNGSNYGTNNGNPRSNNGTNNGSNYGTNNGSNYGTNNGNPRSNYGNPRSNYGTNSFDSNDLLVPGW